MKTYGFRLSPDGDTKIGELFAFYGVSGENFSDQMRLFIDNLYEKLLLYKKSTAASEQTSEIKTDMDVITCPLRISLQDSKSGYACVNRPPKMVKLETIEICKVCKALFMGLTDKTKRLGEQVSKQEPASKEEPAPPQDKHAWIRDPNQAKHLGMTWCRDGGILVFPNKCGKCKTPCDKAPATNPFLSDTERLKRQQSPQPSKM